MIVFHYANKFNNSALAWAFVYNRITNQYRAAEADENQAADVKSWDDEILAKRKENQRLEEERIELEQKLSEKRKEADALKALAPTTTPIPIVADINDNFSMGNEDDIGRVEEGIVGDLISHTSVRDIAYGEGRNHNTSLIFILNSLYFC